MQNVERWITINNPEKSVINSIVRDQLKRPEARIRAEWLDCIKKLPIRSIDIAPCEHGKNPEEIEELTSIIASASRITLAEVSPIPPITIKGLTPPELTRILNVQKVTPEMLVAMLVKTSNATIYAAIGHKETDTTLESLKKFDQTEPLESSIIVQQSEKSKTISSYGKS